MFKKNPLEEKLYAFLSNLEGGDLVKEYLKRHNEIIPLYKKFVAFIEGDVNFTKDDVSRFILSSYFTKLSFSTQVRYKKNLIYFCQHLGRTIPSRLEGIGGFNIFEFDRFLKNFCSIGKGSIWAEKLLRAYNRYRCRKGFSFPITSTTGMTRYLTKKGVETSTKKKNKGNLTYLGLSLNDTGLALIENNFRDSAMLKVKENKNLSPNNACKLITCNPDVLLLKKIVNEYNQKRTPQNERINLLKAKKILKNIEKFCFQKNWNPRCTTKIGLALYLTTTFSFEQLTENCGISNYTPRVFRSKIRREYPRALEHLSRYSKVYSRNPNCLEKIRKKILFWYCQVGYSIPKITKILKERGYKINDLLISKNLSSWSAIKKRLKKI